MKVSEEEDLFPELIGALQHRTEPSFDYKEEKGELPSRRKRAGNPYGRMPTRGRGQVVWHNLTPMVLLLPSATELTTGEGERCWVQEVIAAQGASITIVSLIQIS